MDNENNIQKEDNQSDTRRIRRNQSKYDKQSPRYECFCSKQYLSYPALYLHVKNKHGKTFNNPRTGKKIQMNKLIETLNHKQSYKIYKITIDSLGTEKQKQDVGLPNLRYFQGQSYPDKPVFYQPGNYLNYGNIPYPFQYEPIGNKDQNSQIAKQTIIQTAFSRYFLSLTINSAKQKAEIQLLLGLLINYINQNYSILKQQGEQMEFRRYTAEQNCKYLCLFICYFIKKWIPEAILEQDKYYSFFIKHSNMIRLNKYKKVLQQLLEFTNGQHLQDILQPQIIKHQQTCPQNVRQG